MEYDNIFYQDGYQLARCILDTRPGSEAIIEIMESAYDSIDGLIDSFGNRCTREGLRMDCKKSCAWCCTQAVLVSTHEIMYLFAWMDKHLSSDQLTQIHQGAMERDRHTAQMDAREFLHFNLPCPFLCDTSCLVYPARPMACRIYLSADAESCKQQFDHPDKRDIMARLYEFPLRAGRLFNEGIRHALAQKGIVSSEWLMESFLCQVFYDRGILSRWIDDYKSFIIRELTREENLYMKTFQQKQESS